MTSFKQITVKGFVAIHDVIWHNIKCRSDVKMIKRIASILILIGLFFVLATPSVFCFDQAFVYFLKSNVPYVRDFLNLQFLKSGNPTLANYLIEEYLPGLWVNAVNGLNLMIVDNLSKPR